MALGARRGDILGLVVRQGAALVVAGGVIGVIAAAASSRVLESILYGVTTDDLPAFVAGPLVLVVAALAACWLPARRSQQGRADEGAALRIGDRRRRNSRTLRLRKKIRTMDGADPARSFARHSCFFREIAPARHRLPDLAQDCCGPAPLQGGVAAARH